MMFYVYMLKGVNCKITKTYVGYTNNLKKRINDHNTNKGAKSTKGHKWELIYEKKFMSKSAAMSYEYKITKDRRLRKELINNRNNRKKTNDRILNNKKEWLVLEMTLK